MDAAAHSSEQDGKPAYTTSKQVQAWFLRRSRDLWKSKYADLKSSSNEPDNASPTSTAAGASGAPRPKAPADDHPILAYPALDPWRPAPVVVGGVLRDDCERLGAK